MAVASGLPAQCATSLAVASGCQYSDQRLTPRQWGDKVRGSYPGYAGPWPRVAIWQGTADGTVAPVNGTELRDQWTDVWGIGQTASGTRSLPGGTTESTYDDPAGRPAVALFSVSGMAHGLAVSPGSGADQCGSTGTYYLNRVCSSYCTGKFWGRRRHAHPEGDVTRVLRAGGRGLLNPLRNFRRVPSAFPAASVSPFCLQHAAEGYKWTELRVTPPRGSHDHVAGFEISTESVDA
ncbi:hypothetical protein STENM223S_03863 [Streptomyces tendae]